MIKIDIISGFLGAGKTTLIKKLLTESFIDEKVVLLENEFGEVGVDGALLKDFDIEVREMTSGCICCTIAGDFRLALKEVITLYQPDRVIIEPSGVSKLSDVIKGCERVLKNGLAELNMCITVVDPLKYKIYLKNFKEFYSDQLENSKTIVLSKTQNIDSKKIDTALIDIKNYNPDANIIATPWIDISGDKIVDLCEDTQAMPGIKIMLNQSKLHFEEHHHADDLFQVWGKETMKKYSTSKIEDILNRLDHIDGDILRAKGIVQTKAEGWIQFDYVPKEIIIKTISPDCIGRLCVIGVNMDADTITDLFGL